MSRQDLVQDALAAQRDGRLAEAVKLYRKVLAGLGEAERGQPWALAILNNLGGAQEQLGRTGEAIASYRQAVDLAPAQAVPCYNLADVLRRTGRPDEAIPLLRTACTLDPDLQEAWAALGATLAAGDRPEAALGALRRAVALRETDDVSWCLLGDALQSLGRVEEALPCYEQALRHNPRNSDAHYGNGRAHLEGGRPGKAVAAFEACLALAPDAPAARHDLGKALFQLGCVEKAMPLLRRAAGHGPEAIRSRARENLAIIVPGSPGDDHPSVLQTRRDWAGRLPSRPATPPGKRGKGPLRIGYVSSFFHRDNWMKPVWGLINHHDRQQFQVHLISDAPADRVGAGYRPHPADHFHDVQGQTNEAVADGIRRAGIDLLIDLNGYSAPKRFALFALRPAPVRVGWFNLYATSGLDALDYLIGDDHVIRPDEEAFYTEKVVRVPGSYLTFEVDHPAPEVAPAPARGSGRVTIGCLASQYKITDQVIATWAVILGRCPGVGLLIRNATLGQAEHREHLAGRFASEGIGAGRLTLEGPGEHFEFLRTYDRIDIAVDSFPYSGGTTTMEALWQGVPVVTFDGDRWASRTSVSLLRAAGLDEYVGRDRQDYIDITVRLATAPETPTRLQAFREGVRERLRRSPVCDAGALARSLEGLYRRMWEERTGRPLP